MGDETMSEDDQQYQDSLLPCLCKAPPDFEHSTSGLDDDEAGDVWAIWHICNRAMQRVESGYYDTADEARDAWSKMVRPKQGDTAQLLARARECEDLQAQLSEVTRKLEDAESGRREDVRDMAEMDSQIETMEDILARVTRERDEALKHLAIMVDANVCIVDPACGDCYVCNARSARARLADAPQEDPEHG